MSEMMKWRAIPGFPDYEVSEYGDVRRVTSSKTRHAYHRLKGSISCDGYHEYTLICPNGTKRRHFQAHIIVCEVFNGPKPSADHEVAHKNGSRVANHYSNLEWKTRAENHADIQIHGTALKGIRNGRAKITDDDVRFIRREYFEIKRDPRRSPSELDEKFGLCRSTIIDIARGKTWRHVA